MIIQNKKDLSFSKLHIAGIVPLLDKDTKIKIDFPKHCLQIGERLTVIEYCLSEIAHMGCKSVWIICNDAHMNLIKSKIGNWIKTDLLKKTINREIPVFYIPIQPKHYELRQCLAWNILYGSIVSYQIMNRISKWLLPDKFYVSFPFSIYDYSKINLDNKHKKYICNYNLYLKTPKGKTIKNGYKIGFTFNLLQSFKYRKILEQYVRKYRIECLQKQQKFKYFDVGLEKIFGYDIIEREDLIGKVSWFHRLDNWNSYINFLKEHGNDLKVDGQLFNGDRYYEK